MTSCRFSRDCLAFVRQRLDTYRAQLRGAYFRDAVPNLLGLTDELAAPARDEKEAVVR